MAASFGVCLLSTENSTTISGGKKFRPPEYLMTKEKWNRLGILTLKPAINS